MEFAATRPARAALPGLTALLSIFAALCLAPAAVADPSRDVDSYVLFAYERATFHGKDNSAGVRINSGDVGVNQPLAGEFSLTFLGSGVHAADGTEIVADSAKIVDGSSVWDLYANSTNQPFNVTPHSGPTAFQAPIVPVADLPAAPTCSPGVGDVDVPANGTQSLTPGAWGDVHVGHHGTLRLGAGVYEFANFDGENGTVLETTDATVLRISRQFRIGQESKVGVPGGGYAGSDLARFEVCAAGLPAFNVNQDGIAARSFFVDDRSEFHGQVFNPNHWTTFGNSPQGSGGLYGRFWARGIHSDTAPEFNYRAPESISGRKFLANQNGSDSGKPIAGVHVYIDVNANARFDSGEPDAYTDTNGRYSIGPLYLTGTYEVREEAPGGFDCVFPAGGCTHAVTLGSSGIDHTGNDFGNKPPQDCSNTPDAPVCTPPLPCNPATDANRCGQSVAPSATTAPGHARLSGPGGCAPRTIRARVRGSRIASVRFTLDGRHVKTVKRAPFRVTISASRLTLGAHKLTARVTFVSASGTAPQTKRITLQKCGRKSQSPKFTG